VVPEVAVALSIWSIGNHDVEASAGVGSVREANDHLLAHANLGVATHPLIKSTADSYVTCAGVGIHVFQSGDTVETIVIHN